MLTLYDFPAEPWTHIRTTNVIASSFATIRQWPSETCLCSTSKILIHRDHAHSNAVRDVSLTQSHFTRGLPVSTMCS